MKDNTVILKAKFPIKIYMPDNVDKAKVEKELDVIIRTFYANIGYLQYMICNTAYQKEKPEEKLEDKWNNFKSDTNE